jgi:hypothetical protein
MQDILVALIVGACTGYAVWVLMPAAARRGIARRVQGWPWPEAIGKWLRRTAQAPTGCGCDGCDANANSKPAPGKSQPIRIHRQPKP